MSSARKPSSYLQQHYDKLLMVVVLVLILGSSVLLSLKATGSLQELSGSDSELVAASPKTVAPLDESLITNITHLLSSPYHVPMAHRRMLVGDLRVSSIPDGLPIPFDAKVCPFTGAEQPKVVDVADMDTDGDTMPDIWEDQFGLNPKDPADATVDMDGDGFSNLEEFQGASNPTLGTETPPPPAKLRLLQARTMPFKLRFLGVSRITDTDVRYQLNLRSLEKTYFARMNEEVEGYTVSSYNEQGPEGPVLTLVQGDKTISLTQNKVVDQQARIAQLAFLVDGRIIKVSIGETITLLDRPYKVIDISDIRVVIRDEEAGKDYEVGTISDAERQTLSSGGRAGVSP